MSATVRPTLYGREVGHIHCVGVGGMGVGPLAIYLAQLGFTVTGEDDALGDEMRAQLVRAGVGIGPISAACELVACSTAVPATHPACALAARRGLPIVRRGELLAEVTRDKELVAVCGSHGKTTTTAMLITALRRAGFRTGYVLGGLFGDETAPAATGAGLTGQDDAAEWVVAEIDESDGTIDRFAPEITVAVNLDWDHPDRYRSRGEIEATFAGLFRRTRRAVLASAACEMTARVVHGITSGAGEQSGNAAGASSAAYFTFGPNGDFRSGIADEADDRTTLRLGGRFALNEAVVHARGEFNAANATAALAAAQLMGAPIDAAALAEYPAVRRRQTILSAAGPIVLEDYAHHPAEIQALLASLRRQVPAHGRLMVVFQPHRFSRTAQFKADFASALATADLVYLLDVYGAGEPPLKGGATADLLAEFKGRAPALSVVHVSSDDTLSTALSAEARSADLVVFVGAGDIDRKARAWLSGEKPEAPANATIVAPRVEATSTQWDAFVQAVKPLLRFPTKLTREEPLAGKTTMRVGGAARLYGEPASPEDLKTLLRESRTRQVPVFILGRGSNLIVPDEGVDGLVVSLASEAWASFQLRPNGRVWAGAGLRLKNLCGLAAKAGLVGFEFLEGIPGSVGGALRMNAGAMGGWIFDVVEKVQLITLEGEMKTLAREAMHVDYRHCAELQDAIALGVLLRPASTGDAKTIRLQMDAYAKKRHESQPREPSAGCIFKNPPGTSAGKLIDECGLKGMRIGDAEVSPVHANFIVNRGTATSADVLELVRRVRARVRDVKDVDLRPEVLLYGRKWEDVL